MSAPSTTLTARARLMHIARNVRSMAYGALLPFDSLFRRLNRLSLYPPIHLRRHVGCLGGGFNGPGYEFVVYLRLLAGLRDGQAIWDLACGCGLLELALADLGWEGRVVGTDIHRPCIQWAQRRLGKSLKQHTFEHMDVFNAAYWPAGKLTTAQWLEQFDARDFDVVVAKSLFTHVLPDELDVYFRGIALRLKPGGRAVLTFFLLDEEQARASAEGHARMQFHPYEADARCSVRTALAPTAAVAYPRAYVLERLREAGFNTDRCTIHPGVWSGRPDGLSFQDIVVIER